MQVDKLKTSFWFLLNLVLAALFLNIVFAVIPTVKKFGESLQPVRTISVSAEGKTIVSPDLAQTSFSVISRGQDPERLTDENNQKVSAAIEFVKSEGIDAKDIRTSGYNLSPDYEYDEKTRRSFIVGYTLTQTVRLKIRDFSKVAKVIGGLPPLGVNQIGGITFTVDDPEKFLAEARAEAFRRAQAKAKVIASQNGVRLKKVINVSEFGGPSPIPYFDRYAEGLGGGDLKASLPTIEPGSEELRVQVNLTYSIE